MNLYTGHRGQTADGLGVGSVYSTNPTTTGTNTTTQCQIEFMTLSTVAVTQTVEMTPDLTTETQHTTTNNENLELEPPSHSKQSYFIQHPPS